MRVDGLLAAFSKSMHDWRSFASKAEAKRKLLKLRAKQPAVDERLLPVVSIPPPLLMEWWSPSQWKGDDVESSCHCLIEEREPAS